MSFMSNDSSGGQALGHCALAKYDIKIWPEWGKLHFLVK